MTQFRLNILNSLFAKLMAGFLLVILVSSSIHFFSYRIYLSNLKIEIMNNENERLNRIMNIVDSYLEDTQKTFVNLCLIDDFQKTFAKNRLSSYDLKVLMDECSSYVFNYTFYSSFFIYTAKSDFIITPYGTYAKNTFFDRFYTSPSYTQHFWDEEMKEQFKYRIYPGEYFSDRIRIGSSENKYLVPLAFKNAAWNDFILIILVDIDSLIYSVDKTHVEELYITNQDDELIYPYYSDDRLPDFLKDIQTNLSSTGEELEIHRASNRSQLKYHIRLDSKLIQKQIKEASLTYVFIFAISILVSLVLSLYIVRKVNNPVKQIISIIKKSDADINSADLMNIKNYIQKMDDKDTAYKKEIDSRDSMLKTFFYQAKLKNIYSYISHLKDQISINSEYFIIYFKLHYKRRYYDEVFTESSEGTYFMKEYIGLRIENHFKKSVTLNLEDDQIVSVINKDDEMKNVGEKLQDILKALKHEEDYVIFTVVVSKIYNNVSDLNIGFSNLVKIAQHRQPVGETQFMEEELFKLHNRKVYFTFKQGKQIFDLLCNGEKERCIELIGGILDFNYKQNADAFNIAALCREIINCCDRCLEEIYYDVPEEIDVEKYHQKLNQCVTTKDYANVCIDLISTVSDYIHANRQGKDYIINYVKEYVRKHYQEDIYLELLAEHLNITKAYLSLYFKNKTGINLSDFLNNFRMQKAIELLEGTFMKISDVSKAVGIPNVNTFIRNFKEQTGETPGDYRKRRLE